MGEGKSREQINRAIHAQQLIESELLQETFSDLETSYLNAWKATPLRDVALREKLWMAVSVVGQVKGHLTKVLNDGKLAAADLKMKQGKNG